MSTALKRWLGSLFAIGLLVGGGSVATGQATPTSDLALTHPAHIHAGTCDTLGDVVFPLSNVEMPGQAGTPVAELEPIASPASSSGLTVDELGESYTIVDASLDDILAAEHAINVHLSAEEMGTYISCGDVVGEVTDGTLTFDLEELNDSGYSGQATLMDNGDGTTTVLLTLMDSATSDQS